MAGGNHPQNPFPKPSNALELCVGLRKRDGVTGLISSPWLRRQKPFHSGYTWEVALADLASLPILSPTPEQAVSIDAYVQTMQRRGVGAVPVLQLQIADGATVPDAPAGKSELVLAAHRAFGSESVALRLFWPLVRNHRNWHITMMYGRTPGVIEEAFVTGKAPDQWWR